MLTEHGLKVNLVRTTDGPRLMVWRSDRDRALELLSRGALIRAPRPCSDSTNPAYPRSM
jgi:hypothetical protein